MSWDLVICFSCSVLETCPFECLILPDLPTCCTPGLVGVVTGDGLVQVHGLPCVDGLDGLITFDYKNVQELNWEEVEDLSVVVNVCDWNCWYMISDYA